jgi:secreted PhoX family phosphatase
MTLTRRNLIAGSAAGLAFGGFSRLAEAAAANQTPAGVEASPYINQAPGYGPLKTDPFGLFDLPEGFSYTVVSRAGEPMSDGLVTPYKMDGMGCFGLGRDKVALVRNHELGVGDIDYGPFGVGHGLAGRVEPSRAFDRYENGWSLPGGTTTLIYDMKQRRLESSHLSLTGTLTNCAGGITPWGSWLTCEEVDPKARFDTRDLHGWVFEVPSIARGPIEPLPIRGLGRFRHEAAAVDPRTGVVYLTEDEANGRGLFYRYLPEDRRNLHRGGRLQALGFREQPRGGDTRNWERRDWSLGQTRDVVWIDLDGADNTDGTLGERGQAGGAAWFARGEGVHFGRGELYFTCTIGGPGKFGQIMRYRPSPQEGQAGERDQPGQLTLFVEPADKAVMNMCDNITVGPNGHLYVCEDKTGGINFLKGVTPEGRVYTVGRQAQPGDTDVGSNSEIAGACFSPDGSTMFLNVYSPGTTLAITGPWGAVRT